MKNTEKPIDCQTGTVIVSSSTKQTIKSEHPEKMLSRSPYTCESGTGRRRNSQEDDSAGLMENKETEMQNTVDEIEIPDDLIEAYYAAQIEGDADTMNQIDYIVQTKYGTCMGW